MAENNTAQGSIVVKRLRSGNTIDFYFVFTHSLTQCVTNDGVVVPDWTVAANQPTVTPIISTTQGTAANIESGEWLYNGVKINFGDDNISTNTFLNGKGQFQIDPKTYALKIIQNIASSTNQASDTLTFNASAEVSGVEYNLSKAISVNIVPFGASSYRGVISIEDDGGNQFTSENDTISLKALLWDSNGSSIENFYVRWYVYDKELTYQNGVNTLHVSRDDVNGSAVVLAQFYLEESDKNFVTSASVTLYDTYDEYYVNIGYDSNNQEVTDTENVTVNASAVKRNALSSGGGTVCSTVDWTIDCWDTNTLTSILDEPITFSQKSTSDLPTFTVTKDHTDYKKDGASATRDVLVIFDAEIYI